MWKAEFRPMTAEERAELRAMESGLAPSWRIRIGRAVRRLLRGGRGSGDPFLEDLRGDLIGGKVQVVHATTARAVRMAHPDGRLAGYFVDVGSGLLMFIEAREWEPYVSGPDFESQFPCTRFSLIRAPGSGADLDFRCEGRRFAPSREVAAPPLRVLDALVRDGELLPGRLESLEGDLSLLL